MSVWGPDGSTKLAAVGHFEAGVGTARVSTGAGRVRTARREGHGVAGMQFGLHVPPVVGGLGGSQSQTNVLLC
jgi:hypothetical protein